jgi:hypothetical protein
MSARLWVEVPEGLNSAQAECQIQNVMALEGPHVGAEIESGGKKTPSD